MAQQTLNNTEANLGYRKQFPHGELEWTCEVHLFYCMRTVPAYRTAYHEKYDVTYSSKC